jgi:hypothetical protein
MGARIRVGGGLVDVVDGRVEEEGLASEGGGGKREGGRGRDKSL